jgi:hypothetical protein
MLNQDGATSVTLDDFSSMEANAQPIDLKTIKLDAEGMPEELRGKSAQEVVEYATRLKEAVRISEEARVSAQQQAELALRSNQFQPQQQKAPEPEPELTREQLAEMMSNDPVAAMEYISTQTTRRVAAQYEERLRPLMSNNVNSAEDYARDKYKDEFAILGKDIDQLVASIPGGRQGMTSRQAGDDLVSLVRGRNFDKLGEYRSQATRETRQEAAEGQSGITMRNTQAPRQQATTNGQLDATQLEIADKLGMTPAEYINWSKVS